MTGNVRAGFSESNGDRLAKPSRRSGDQRNFSLEFESIQNHDRVGYCAMLLGYTSRSSSARSAHRVNICARGFGNFLWLACSNRFHINQVCADANRSRASLNETRRSRQRHASGWDQIDLR